jgi:hypothetical protein
VSAKSGRPPAAIRSYYVRYWATREDLFLLGGVKQGTSCRFQRMEDARDRYQSIIDVHRPGAVAGEILGSPLYPEIFVHCAGAVPQAIGGRCEKCKKVLTKEDAKLAKTVG